MPPQGWNGQAAPPLPPGTGFVSTHNYTYISAIEFAINVLFFSRLCLHHQLGHLQCGINSHKFLGLINLQFLAIHLCLHRQAHRLVHDIDISFHCLWLIMLYFRTGALRCRQLNTIHGVMVTILYHHCQLYRRHLLHLQEIEMDFNARFLTSI